MPAQQSRVLSHRRVPRFYDPGTQLGSRLRRAAADDAPFPPQNSNKTFCDKGFSSEVDYKTFASIVDVVRTFEMDAREKQLSDIQVRLGALREIQAPARASGNGDRPWATPVPEPESNAASAMLGLFLLGVICGGVVYWVRKNRMAEIEAERAPPVDPNAITENPEEHEELSLVA